MEHSRPANSYLLRCTYKLYAFLWKKLILITLPPAVISYLIYSVGGELIAALNRWLLPSNLLGLRHQLVKVSIATFTIRAIYFGSAWVLTTLAFAASANAVIEGEMPKREGLGDNYSAVRERLSRLVRVGMISYVPAALGWMVVFAGSAPIVFKLLPLRYFMPALMILACAGIVALFSLLCRFGLTVPYLIDRPQGARLGEAMRVSLRLTEGYESYFAVLVLKVVVASVGGYELGRYVLGKLWLANTIGDATFQWLSVVWGIALAVTSEPVLFIGLTVLYKERTRATAHSAEAHSSAAAGNCPSPIIPQ
jgi:hypothetical protein